MSGGPRIAVVGAGIVGGNLVRRLAELGDDITIAARDPGSDAVRSLSSAVPRVPVTELGAASRDADVVVLAVPATSVADAAAAVLAGRPSGAPVILVDATNDMAGNNPARSPYRRVVEAASGRSDAAVVKAFNTIGAEAILHPVIDGRRLFLPIAGPEPAAEVVRAIADRIGFDALVIGDADAVHHLEAHARLWIHLAFRRGLGRGFGFALQRPVAP